MIILRNCCKENNYYDGQYQDRHKQKSVGLTEEEKVEQAKLRKEYLDAVKGSLRAHLNNIDIKEKDGSITNLGEKYGRKKGN